TTRQTRDSKSLPTSTGTSIHLKSNPPRKGYANCESRTTQSSPSGTTPLSLPMGNNSCAVPKLPATLLRYDSVAHSISRRDGEIDYLIVGSGPAGSVLGHELRRGGKRVLVIER